MSDEMTNRPDAEYDRQKLVTTLVYHQPTATMGCHCGWAELGASHPEHVADVYEQAIEFEAGTP